jgi:hypothetical protein
MATKLGSALDKATRNIVDREYAEDHYKKEAAKVKEIELEPKVEPKQAVGKKSGGKVKKYADGGMTQQPTYPFYGNQPQAGGQNGGTNQTFNMQPQANAGAPNPQQQPMQTFKKGGKVSSASKRADGCAIRGKTRA